MTPPQTSKRVRAAAEWFAGMRAMDDTVEPDESDFAYAESIVDAIEEADAPCPDCKGRGYVTRSSHFDHGPNMSGSTHWSEPCPRGCQWAVSA